MNNQTKSLRLAGLFLAVAIVGNLHAQQLEPYTSPGKEGNTVRLQSAPKDGSSFDPISAAVAPGTVKLSPKTEPAPIGLAVAPGTVKLSPKADPDPIGTAVIPAGVKPSLKTDPDPITTAVTPAGVKPSLVTEPDPIGTAVTPPKPKAEATPMGIANPAAKIRK